MGAEPKVGTGPGPAPARILVVQTAFLGDVVLTTPLLSALRRRFPAARLAALVIPGTRDILDGHPHLDEVMVFDKKGADRGLRGLRAAARRIRDRAFDLCLLPHRSTRSALLAALAGIPSRIGFDVWPAGFWYTRRVKWDPARHDALRNLELARPLGIDPGEKTGGLWSATDERDRDWAARALANHGIAPGDRVIGIAPGSVWATKRWLPDGFAAVADALSERHGAKVLLLGSRDDLPVLEQVMRFSRGKPVSLGGRTTLRQLAALLSRCGALITNDNGAMHVAVAQGVPVVAVFGSTTLSLGYGPFTDRAIVVEKPLDCRPCGKHGYRSCPLGHFNCMKQVGPEEVVAAVERIMGMGSRELGVGA